MTRRFVIFCLVLWIVENTGCQGNSYARAIEYPRMRRLHLVRPDLIFTPLDWAVYC